MRPGLTWRGPVLLGVSVLVALAVAPSTAKVGAAPVTTPVSGAPTPSPTPSSPTLHPSVSIDPGQGPVATEISYDGACGAQVRTGSSIAWGVDFSPDAGSFTPSHLINIGFGFSFDSTSGPAMFHGTAPVPANLLDGTAVTPGLYYVNAACLCARLASCPGGVEVGIGPGVILAPQPFCVTSPHPTFAERVCLDNNGWLSWIAGHLGVGRFLAAALIGLMSGQSSTPFATPALPPPPPPSTTPTTRRQVTTTTPTTTTPTTTTPTAATEPLTTPTQCVPPPPCYTKPCPPPCP